MRFTYPSFLYIIALLFLSLPALAQTHLLQGYVRAAGSGEYLVGATVSVPGLQRGTVTDEQGFYSLNLPNGEHVLQATYIGFTPSSQTITVAGKAQRLNIALEAASNQISEVQVESASLRQRLNDTRMSVDILSSRDAKLLPSLFGEVDLIKTLQLKPGVQSSGEGTAGLYVRGGGPDQNLVLLDDAVIYNASHLFGFFSVFNPDAVKSVELYKGGFPAQFGGRLSSVVDVKQNEGSDQQLSARGGLGLIASRLTVEGPIQKDKSSFILSGRRTYVDIFTRQLNRLNENNDDYNPIPDYYFYDLNGKLNFKLGKKDELSLSGYYGRDFFGFKDSDFVFGFDWGNTMANLRWRHKFSNNLYATTSMSTTGYKYNINNRIDIFSIKLTSDIKDYTLKTDFDWFLGKGHSLKFGALATRHYFTVGRLNFTSEDNSQNFSSGNEFEASEFGAYVSDDYTINALLSVNYGLRVSAFNSGGKTYSALEPRASAKYNLNESTSVKASYASMMQYVHLVANSGASLPTDIWYPSTSFVKPQRSQQVALGLNKLLGKGRYLLTNEVYYKWMRNQIDFRDGANLFVNDSLENEFLFGRGESYGNEIYLERVKGKTTGWLGYTLSWTYRQFEEINEGRRFPTRYDRRHDISLVVLHQLNKRLSLTGSFVFGTGQAISLPVARFPLQDVEGKNPTIIPVYEDRNTFRLAPYHRLDLGAVLKLKPKRGEADLTFSVYNVYNRRNPYFVYFEQIKDKTIDETVGFQAKQVSLFPAIPSVTYNFKF
ncbi:TonB-dependent receptor [Pontibacter akesuensis]|uniref:TonB-dependent Receptor Plug Domain n=1 Tax=Pontibacter akesuensis TaxID=388950 RepID=A0A1I7H1I2_9BACT|nr:TonB-dependent receptor [Pontibacter akesuensis]GHA53986.1 TonB-dependent receptor [Pontibacter akesuensis]SFU54548.1 TonB-dependent Receptor Plug Domain [Pontibacter akesuensis]